MGCVAAKGPPICLAVLQTILNVVLSPPPQGVPGEGPGAIFLRNLCVLGRVRPGSGGGILVLFLILALSAAGFVVDPPRKASLTSFWGGETCAVRAAPSPRKDSVPRPAPC